MGNVIKLLTFLSFLLLGIGCNNKASNKNLDPAKLGLDTATDTYYVTQEDRSMNQAIGKAKNTIALFDEAIKSKNLSYTDFAVKKRYETGNDGGEHIWVAILEVINGNYKGVVNNDAEVTKEVKYGDTVIIRRDEITDWMYIDNNTLRGGYTIREIRNKMSKEERKIMDKEIGFTIED